MRGAAKRRTRIAATCFGSVLADAGCGNDGSGSADACRTDQNGASGGSQVVDLTVNDVAFSVGAADSGSTEPNITVENAATVTLTIVNAGSKPHDLVVHCRPTPNGLGCPVQSCFPPGANIPPLQPGASATTTFVAPFQEGAYLFTSDIDGDTQTAPDGSVAGLVGELVLM